MQALRNKIPRQIYNCRKQLNQVPQVEATGFTDVKEEFHYQIAVTNKTQAVRLDALIALSPSESRYYLSKISFQNFAANPNRLQRAEEELQLASWLDLHNMSRKKSTPQLMEQAEFTILEAQLAYQNGSLVPDIRCYVEFHKLVMAAKQQADLKQFKALEEAASKAIDLSLIHI